MKYILHRVYAYEIKNAKIYKKKDFFRKCRILSTRDIFILGYIKLINGGAIYELTFFRKNN